MSESVIISTPAFIHLGIPDQLLVATEAFFDDAVVCSDSRLIRQWDEAQLKVDFFTMVTSLFSEVNYEFTNGSFAFSLG